MPAFSAYAPGKIILLGEHAVVYGRPAIAVPVHQVQTRAVIEPAPKAQPGQFRILAPDIDLDAFLSDLPPDQPLAYAVHSVLQRLNIPRITAGTLRVTSTIPIASGMGSGAAVAAAVIRALGAFLGHPFDDQQVSELTFEVEKLHHGTPSGIDNTVIVYRKPVYFVAGQPVVSLQVAEPFVIVIGDTGISSPTVESVMDVRRLWTANRAQFIELFDRIAVLVNLSRQLIEQGPISELGTLMDSNQALLQEIGVSSPELDQLIDAGRAAGALGAKLSGGGRGGNMISLVMESQAVEVEQALLAAGAQRTIVTRIG